MSLLLNGTSNLAIGTLKNAITVVGSNITVVATARINALPTGTATVFSLASGTTFCGMSLQVDSSGAVTASANFGASTATTTALGNVVPGQIFKVAIVKSGAAAFDVYLDKLSNKVSSTASESSSTIDSIVLGAAADGVSNFFNGEIEDVATFAAALSDADITAVLSSTNHPTAAAATPDNYWPALSSDASTTGSGSLVRTGATYDAVDLVRPTTIISIGDGNDTNFTGTTVLNLANGEFFAPFTAANSVSIEYLALKISSWGSSGAVKLTLRDGTGTLLASAAMGMGATGNRRVRITPTAITAGQLYYLGITGTGSLTVNSNVTPYQTRLAAGSSYASTSSSVSVTAPVQGVQMPEIWAEAAYVPTIVNINGNNTVSPGQSENSLVTTGLGTIQNLNIGSIIAANFVQTAPGITAFDLPNFTNGVAYPAYGTYTASASDGTNSANLSVTLGVRSGWTSVTLTDVTTNSGQGYLQGHLDLAVGDVVTYKTATRLGVTNNAIGADGLITTDYLGTQKLWVRSVATGIMTVVYIKSNTSVDTTPDAFTFTAKTGVEANVNVVSNAITVSGIDIGQTSPIFISGGLYSINGAAYTAQAGNVSVDDNVTVEVLSSSAYNDLSAATLNIGGVTSTFTVTTRNADTTPIVFNFTPLLGSSLSSVVTSAPVAITGIDAGQTAVISIANGTYSINGGGYTAADGVVSSGDQITVRLTTSASYSTPVSADVTIGGVTSSFTAATRGVDTTPDVFTFQTVSGAAISTDVDSSPISVAGVDAGQDVPITVINGQYAVDSGSGYGAFTSSDGVVRLGYNVKVRLTSGSSNGTTVTATLNIGGVTGTFSVLTGTPDTSPDAFTFTTVNGAEKSTATESNVIAVAGVTGGVSVPVSIVGGVYAINTGSGFGSFTSAAGNIQLGQQIKVRLTSSASYLGVASATLTMGGVDGIFTVNTRAADTTPNAFTFTAQTNIALSANAVSNAIIVAGIDSDQTTAISITGGQYSVNGGSYTSSAGTVAFNDSITVRVAASSSYSTNTSATLTIGGVSSTFTVTTIPVPVAITSVGSGTILAESTSNPIVSSGISSANSFKIDGVAMVLTGSGDSYSFRVPTMSTGTAYPKFGTVTGVLTDGTLTASKTFTFAPKATQDFVTLTSVSNTGSGYIAKYIPGVAVGDQISFSKPSALGVTANGVDVDGRIFTDYYGSQTMWWRSASTGLVTMLNTITPNQVVNAPTFTLTAVNNAEAFTVTESNIITVNGVTAGVDTPISVTGGLEYAVNSGTGFGAFTNANGVVRLGYLVKVRLTSASTYNTPVTGTLTIAGINGTFTVTTRAADITPNALVFPTVSGAAVSTLTTSSALAISGVDAGQDIPITITGGAYAIDAGSGYGAFVTTPGIVRLGYNVKVQVTSPATANQTASATLSVGGVAGSFTVSTGAAADTTPDAFTFTAVTGAEVVTSVDSAAITVAGVTAATDIPISITGGTYAIDNGTGFGAFTSSAGVVQLGYGVKVRVSTTSAFSHLNTATLSIGGVTADFNVTTRAADLVPDAISFTGVTGATVNQLYTSNAVAITGVDAGQDVAISITGGQYAVDPGTGTYGAYTSSPGVVRLGYNVKVQLAASASANTTLTATLTVGGVNGIYSVNTGTADTTPDAFTFTAVTGAEVSTVSESSVITVAGITTGTDVPITIVGGTYAINPGTGTYGSFTSAPGVVRLGYSVKVRLTTGATYSNLNTATLTIGGISGAFNVTTRAADLTPNGFVFAPATNVSLSTDYESNAITVAGVDAGQDVAISITGGQYAINTGSGYGAYTSSAGVIRGGQTVKVKVTSSSLYATASTATLTIGNVVGNYVVTTRAADVTPSAFAFAAVNNANMSAQYESNAITVSGVDAGQDIVISITGGQYAVNSGSGWSAYTANNGVVHLGDQVKVSLTSASTTPAITTATLTIGGISGSYVVNTSNVDVTPDPFQFNPVVAAVPSLAYLSGAITVAGVTVDQPIDISVTGGQYQVTHNGVSGPWKFLASKVYLGDTVKLFGTAPATFGTTQNVVVTIGGMPGTFSITTRAADTSPKPPVFEALNGALLSTDYESNVIVVSAVDTGVDIPISITGGSYAIAANNTFGSFVTTDGVVRGGQSVKVKVTSSGSYSTGATATLTVGGQAGAFTVTTKAAPAQGLDDVPDANTFTTVANAELSSTVYSEEITIAGMTADTAIPITVTGAAFYVNDGTGYGAQIVGSSTVKLGYKVKLAVHTPNYFSTTTVARVNVNGLVETFTVTTRDPIIDPAAINLPTVQAATPTRWYMSDAAAITGIEQGATTTLSVSGGLEYSIDRGNGFEAWTRDNTTVKTHDVVKTRLLSSTVIGGTKVGYLIIAGEQNAFTIYNRN